MLDPEELTNQRREREASKSPATDAAPAEQSPGQQRTAEMLARWREGDDLVAPVRWLARWRGDRHDLAQIAADESIDVAQIRAGIDRAARAEGTTFAALEAIRNRPPRRLGQAKQLRLVGS